MSARSEFYHYIFIKIDNTIDEIVDIFVELLNMLKSIFPNWMLYVFYIFLIFLLLYYIAKLIYKRFYFKKNPTEKSKNKLWAPLINFSI